jgi:hypothetical protein
LQRLADFGHGACELVESEERLDEAMSRIHRLLGAPVLTGLRCEPLNFELVGDSQAPAQVGDLFADRPVTFFGRHLAPGAALRMRLHATDAAGRAWREEVVGLPAPHELLLSMWGRAKVRDLEDQFAAGKTRDAAKLTKRIVDTSLESHVLSRFTAYVAVDRDEIINQGGVQEKIVQPVEMPAGWTLGRALSPPAGAAMFAFSLPSLMRKSVGSRRRSSPPPAAPADELESVDSCLMEFTDTAIDFTETAAAGRGDEADIDHDDAPVPRLVRLVLQEAVAMRASEIRIEPAGDRVRVHYVIEGRVVDRDSVPLRLHKAFVARIAVLAGLPLLEEKDPRHGRLQVVHNQLAVEWDVTIQPMSAGGAVHMVRVGQP